MRSRKDKEFVAPARTARQVPKPVLQWSIEGTDVVYGSLRWKFTKLKARIFLTLAEARATAFPEVPASRIRQAADTETDIRQVFYRDPAWRRLIIPLHPLRKGFYRLATDQELWMMHEQNMLKRKK